MTALDFSDPQTANLGSRQKLVLAALRKLEPATAREIAELVATSPSNVHSSLGRLEAKGLVTSTRRIGQGHQRDVWTSIYEE